MLSKCCRCVKPPLKDVFGECVSVCVYHLEIITFSLSLSSLSSVAAARTAAGEVRVGSTVRGSRSCHNDSRYGTQGKASQAGTLYVYVNLYT